MIKCKKCKFSVGQNMKFALMKNICPSCGAPLFTQNEEQDINAIQSRVINQEFAAELTETQVYDVALFFFSELNSGLGQIFIQREIAKIPKRTINAEGEEVEAAEPDKELENIREEIAKEVGADRLPDDIENAEVTFKHRGDEDPDDKVSRLKRLARMNNKKSGPAVKRVG